MNLSETKRLKELEKENDCLKKLVTEQALDIYFSKIKSISKPKPGPERRWW